MPEVLASVCWCVPYVLCTEGYLRPFFYPIYLTVLLLDRAWRDEARCAAKYKEDWEKYRTIVPFRVIPGLL